jgi:sugar/nucleoside kinase (ribokinase family)
MLVCRLSTQPSQRNCREVIADGMRQEDISSEAYRAISCLQVLSKLPRARGVLVTAGGDGASYCMRTHGKLENSGVVPVYDVDVQDTTGAGDAFTCGFLAYLLAEVRSCD